MWRATSAGKYLPLDTVPVRSGNVWVRAGRAHVYRDAAAAIDDGAPPDELRTSHFATCPDAATFRAPR